MELNIFERNGLKFAEIIADEVVLNDVSDALDIIGDCGYNGAQVVIVRQENIIPDFFELRTRIAGEVLQKFTQYDTRLAIVGDFSNVESKSLRDFIRESNRQGRILFVASPEEAFDKFR